jgi:D-amino-acid oxidase
MEQTPDNNVLVLGAGIIGLQTAVCILQRCSNLSVTIWCEKRGVQTTSNGAGASWTPEVDLGPIEKTKLWSEQTLNYFTQLSKENENCGVYMRDGFRFQSEYLPLDANPPLPLDFNLFKFEKLCGLELITSTNDTENILSNTPYYYAWKYKAPCINMSKYLEYLEAQFYKLGGKAIICKKIDQIDQIINQDRFNVIMNCTGLGSRELFNDKNVIPIRGQIIKVQFPSVPGIHNKNYFFKVKDGQGTYMYPRGNGIYVLGGTFLPNQYDTRVNSDTAQDIMNRCAKMVPQFDFSNAKLLEHWVGLRPHRTNGVRLETEIIREKAIIHHYRHSGSGVTLSYGSSLAATQLVLQQLQLKSKL